MELTLVRHGQSQSNIGEWYDGPEPHLTEQGRRQARYAAERVRGMSFDAFYSSCMSRALETACALAESLGMEPSVWVPLAEHRTLPGFRGCPRSDLASRYPRIVLPEECTEEGWWHHGLEDNDALYDRAQRMVADLRALHEETRDRVLLVTHGGFGSALLDVLLGLPPVEYQRFDQYNCAFSEIHVRPDATRLTLLNCTLHLPRHEIT
jgi:2,3-bisphosphoglycerate-dependent phosphoglycerate mutase